MLTMMLFVGLTACKKDQKTDPVPPKPAEVKAITLTDLKALSTGASVKVPDNKKISGIVISEVSSKNVDGKTVILEEATTQIGIVVTFDAAQTFALGDQLEVNISNQTLAQVNGEIVLQNIPAANAKKIGTGTITPRSATVAEVIKNAVAYNGTLVKLPAGTFVGNGKFSGTLSYIDASGTIKSQVLTGSTLDNTAYPSSLETLTGIIRFNGTEPYINLRNANDVKGVAVPYIFTEDFSGARTKYPILGESVDFFKPTLRNAPKHAFFITNLMENMSAGLEEITGYSSSFYNKVKTYSANDPDAGLMVPGKNYIVHISNGVSTNVKTTYASTSFSMLLTQDRKVREDGSGTDINPPKSVTVVFAGSKTSVADYPLLTTGSFKDPVFNPVSDKTVAYRVTIRGLNDRLVATSETFYDLGKWHSVTLNMNTVVNEKTWTINIETQAIRGTVSNFATYYDIDPPVTWTDEIALGTPILIDKIVLNYDSKPYWAK